MQSITNDLISILQFLLPGFIAGWVFYSLTSYSKPSQFERVIQALIFTLFIQAFVGVIEYLVVKVGQYWSFISWSELSGLVASVLTALIFGVVFSYFANNDKIHDYLRAKKITRETSFTSEWFGTFVQNITFVVLHFEDERRLYGWLHIWPTDPSNGHFLIDNPSWLGDDGEENRITGVKKILVNVKDVKWVEFLENTWEN